MTVKDGICQRRCGKLNGIVSLDEWNVDVSGQLALSEKAEHDDCKRACTFPSYEYPQENVYSIKVREHMTHHEYTL